MKKESLNDELKGLSPWLHDMKWREDGFRLPEGYFERLEGSVFTQIEASGVQRKPILEVKKDGSLRAWIFRPQVLIAVAAALTLILAALWFFKPNPAPASAQIATTELSEAEIEAYVLDNIRDFEAEQLAMLTPDEVAPQESELPETLEIQSKTDNLLNDLSEEELELLLKEMSEEELKSLL